jgi:hypothetical protein
VSIQNLRLLDYTLIGASLALTLWLGIRYGSQGWWGVHPPIGVDRLASLASLVMFSFAVTGAVGLSQRFLVHASADWRDWVSVITYSGVLVWCLFTRRMEATWRPQ